MRNKIATITIFAIMALAAVLRTYKIHEPLGDWHSWRQSDTASVAREYVKAGKIDLLQPHYQDVSSIPSGLDNPSGWRFVEFPLRDGLHAQLVMWFPSVGLVEWGRIISIVASTLTVGLIYLIVARLTGRRAGIFSALVFAILPFNVFYGRVILPEPMLVLWMMIALYTFMRFWDKSSWRWYLGTLVSLTLAILCKPTALVILLPMIGYALPNFVKKLKLTFFSILLPALALIPYFLWRKYLASYPMGIPASDWLFNGNGIRLKGAWFRWLFGERIAKMIFGYWGLIPFGLGVQAILVRSRRSLTYLGLLAGSLAYMVVIATGNVQHDYYQIQIMPTLAIMAGLGIDYAIRLATTWYAKLATVLFMSFTIVLGLALSWYELQGFFWVNNRAMVAAGVKVDQIVPQDALVIAPLMGDTAFLFQTNRRGWPIGGAIDDKIKKGASYYVTTTKDSEYQELVKQYSLVEDNDQFSIIKLSK